MFVAAVIVILFIVLIVVLSNKKEQKVKTYHPYGCFDEDDIMFLEMMDEEMREERLEEMEDSVMMNSDISEMNPADLMYFDEDGDIMEDL